MPNRQTHQLNQGKSDHHQETTAKATPRNQVITTKPIPDAHKTLQNPGKQTSTPPQNQRRSTKPNYKRPASPKANKIESHTSPNSAKATSTKIKRQTRHNCPQNYRTRQVTTLISNHKHPNNTRSRIPNQNQP